MGPPPRFEIHESHNDGWLRLRLAGQLDLASAPTLDDRLTRLRAIKSPVRLDLSQLDFIDSTGIHLLVRTIGEARVKHWALRIDPDVSPQVMRLFKLVRLDQFIFS
jgi:anti-anti-sigma factor